MRTDVAVIGAGPAGSFAARELARAGAGVVLFERARFPRDKVCGGCLHPRATAILRDAGLGDVVAARDAAPVRDAELRLGPRRSVRVDLPAGGVALPRRILDLALFDAAVAAGATARVGHAARIAASTAERVLIEAGGETIEARVVIVARGATPSAVDEPGPRAVVHPRSRIGVGGTSRDGAAWPVGRVVMACARDGYAGTVRVGEEILVAAAIDPDCVRGRPTGDVVAGILEAAGSRMPADLHDVSWRGAPPLTRDADPVATRRVFAVGDAAGYVEPFTGEGIAWALATGRAVVPLALEAIREWDDALIPAWRRGRRAALGRRPLLCRATSSLFHVPRIAGLVLPWLGRRPERLLAPMVRVAYAGAVGP